MNKLSVREAVQNAADLLCAWLDCKSSQIIFEQGMSDNQLRSYAVDAIIYIKDIAYLIEYKNGQNREKETQSGRGERGSNAYYYSKR